MSIEDLKRRQQAADAWRQFSDDLQKKLLGSLGNLQPAVEKATGLNLDAQTHGVIFSPKEDHYEIPGRSCLLLRVLGLSAEAYIGTVSCSINRSTDGSWKIHVHENGERVFTASNPLIPLWVSGLSTRHYLWWNGPQDNGKLVSVLVDTFDNKARASEF